MDWFWNIFDSIIQNRIWHFLFGNFHLVDWITAVFAGIGLFYGLKQGFFRCVAVTLETIALLWFIMVFYKKTAGIILQNLSFIGDANSRPVAYAVLLFFGGALTVLLDGKLKTIFHTKLAGPVRSAGGAVFGVFFLLLLLSLGSYLIVLSPFAKLHQPYADGGSRTGPFISHLAPSFFKGIAHPTKIFEKAKT